MLGGMLFKGDVIPRQAARGLMLLTLASDSAQQQETWIRDLHDSAFKQATDDERQMALMFLERHWSLVTTYLSSAVTEEIATLIDVYKTYPQDPDHTQLRRIAQDRLGLVVDFMPGTQLPTSPAALILR